MAYQEMGNKEPAPYKHDAEADKLERNSVALGHVKALDTVSNWRRLLLQFIIMINCC